MTTHIRNRFVLGPTLAVALLAACGSSGSGTKQVAITFKGVVSGQPFSCSTTYAGIGTNADAANRVLTPQDFRFYVHDVRLVNAAGQDVAVNVTDDGAWQYHGTVLLDFEDGSGKCVQGTPGTHDRVIGTVPDDTYTGLRFKIGVPFEQNHLLADAQPAPLNLSAMYWSWTGGYRFMRIEGASTGAVLHLGSTGCTLVDGSDPRKGVTSCANPNRAEIDLAAFDVDTNKVVLDLANLWSGTDLATNAAGTAPGCMSAPTDPDCSPIFPKLGLPLGTSAGGTQTLFTKE